MKPCAPRARRYRSMFTRFALTALFSTSFAAALPAETFDYRVLATSKTSTMEKEMNETAAAGFRFAAVMGGDTAAAGSEVVVIMQKGASATADSAPKYRLLATSRTSTMQKEIQDLGDEGYEYKGQSVFSSTFGGKEVVVILERDPAFRGRSVNYRLLATNRTSTMQKELKQSGDDGYKIIGMTVGKTAMGGSELVSILRKAE
jgi:hypothetical protein